MIELKFPQAEVDRYNELFKRLERLKKWKKESIDDQGRRVKMHMDFRVLDASGREVGVDLPQVIRETARQVINDRGFDPMYDDIVNTIEEQLEELKDIVRMKMKQMGIEKEI